MSDTNSICQATTPTLTFNLPISTSLLVVAYVTLKQGGKTIVEKDISDCVLNDKVLSTKLTQDDTLLLETKSDAEIQIRVRTTDNSAFASQVFTVPVARILKGGVI